jgi:hypothetical protein
VSAVTQSLSALAVSASGKEAGWPGSLSRSGGGESRLCPLSGN